MRFGIKNYIFLDDDLTDFERKFPVNPDAGSWKSSNITPDTGWIRLPERALESLEKNKGIASEISERYNNLVTIGMGGSSRPTEVASMFKRLTGSDGVELYVLETLDEKHIENVLKKVDTDKTLFLIISKSGNTEETISLANFVAEKGCDFNIITTKNVDSELMHFVERNDIDEADIYEHPDNIGGRYNFFSKIGMIPCAAAGVDNDGLLKEAKKAMLSEHKYRLGKFLFDMEKQGRIYARIVLDDDLKELGSWVEQLISESLGKKDEEGNERGIIAVTEREYDVDTALNNNIFLLRIAQDPDPDSRYVRAANRSGTPVVEFIIDSVEEIANIMYVLEFSTAMSGILLGLDPFDQPGVDAKKRITSDRKKFFSEELESQKDLENVFDAVIDNYRTESRVEISDGIYLDYGDFVRVLEEEYDISFEREMHRLSLHPKDPVDVYIGISRISRMLNKTYFGILPYNESYREHDAWREARQLALDFGFNDVFGTGPVYEHSYSQFFQEGYNFGLLCFIISTDHGDIEIPDDIVRGITFSMQNTIQGLASMQALIENKISRLAFWIEIEADKGWNIAIEELEKFYSAIREKTN